MTALRPLARSKGAIFEKVFTRVPHAPGLQAAIQLGAFPPDPILIEREIFEVRVAVLRSILPSARGPSTTAGNARRIHPMIQVGQGVLGRQPVTGEFFVRVW